MIRVKHDQKPEGDSSSAPTWQQQLYPGLYPESVAEQGTLFDLGRPERKLAARPEDPAQPEMFS
jgi:hypothetical protein